MRTVQITVFVLWGFGVLGGSLAGTSSAYHHHRTTSLDELKEIDSYVATGLPLFDHGFFVSTAQGPILVKAKEEGMNQKKPQLNPGYYSTLPRLIPSGYEGISISHFNLGSAIPIQSHSLFPHPSQVYADAPLQQYPHQRHYYPQGRPPFLSQLAQQSAPVSHQFQPKHSQTQSRHFIQHHPQRRQDRFIDNQSQQQSPVAQDTFQIDNFLNAEQDDVPTSYQNTMITHEPVSTRKLIRNPTVEHAFEFDETLPDNLRNPFYKNQALASALAQESLPVDGETIVGEWDTTKIQKKRISDLLSAAGFL